MMERLQRLVTILTVLIQILLTVVKAETTGLITPGSHEDPDLKPSAAFVHSSISSHDPHEQHERSSQDIVVQALSILRPLESTNRRYSTRKSGLLATVGYFLSDLIPRVYVTGPRLGQDVESNRRLTPKSPLWEGVALLTDAAKYNNSDAIYLLAQMSFYGNFTYPKNLTEAFRRYSQLSSLSGNSSAQHMLGFMYATGIGNAVQRDPAKALLFHTFAAQAGHTRSEMTVAFRYHTGIGTSRNCDEAVVYYKKVADKAINWYRSGPPGGRTWVPDSYSLADDDGGVYGEGASVSSAGINAQRGNVLLDSNAALDDVLEYLDLMSGKGDFKATFSLGRIYYDGQKGLDRDFKAAKRYFQIVAGQYWKRDGTTAEITDRPGLEKFACKAAGYIGRIFLRGEGVETNYAKSLEWFRRGITAGDAGSQNGLGLMYLYGLGVPRDAHKAADFFRAAADQDYSPAQVNIGVLFLDQGQVEDLQIANRYFELAARYGHIEALYYLAEMANLGIGRDRSCGLATAYYKTVSEKAEPFLSSFGEANEVYSNGDRELALVDFMMAAEQGYETGQANVAYLLDQEKSMLRLLQIFPLSRPISSLLDSAGLALIYWTRSAKQGNIDSMVKMGDYYLKGVGTDSDMEKSAACYTAASEFHQSAQALYNLGWMHENGVGLTQDFHLAKRFYDQALETNDEAYLAVILGLLKLRLRSAWNTLTNGRINSIRDEPALTKQWSLAEWINNFVRDGNLYYEDDEDEEDLLRHSDSMAGVDDGMYDDIIEDGVIESFIIIALAASLVWLIYYRQQRQLAHRQNDRNAANEVGNQQEAAQVPQPDDGLFPRPGDPAFPGWLAGGIGH